MGEIRDEYDEDEEELIQDMGNRQYLVEGSMKLDDVNSALDINLISEDYDSIGGILIGMLDRLPTQGESVITPDGMILVAQVINQNRIE